MAAPNEPPPGDRSPRSGRGSGDAAALGPNGVPAAKRPRGHSDLDASGGKGELFSGPGSHKRSGSVQLATPSPRRPPAKHALGEARPQKARPAGAAEASGAANNGHCSDNIDSGSNGSDEGDGTGANGRAGNGGGAAETWVQCEGCAAWQRLPGHVRAEDLPDAW